MQNIFTFLCLLATLSPTIISCLAIEILILYVKQMTWVCCNLKILDLVILNILTSGIVINNNSLDSWLKLIENIV